MLSLGPALGAIHLAAALLELATAVVVIATSRRQSAWGLPAFALWWGALGLVDVLRATELLLGARMPAALGPALVVLRIPLFAAAFTGLVTYVLWVYRGAKVRSPLLAVAPATFVVALVVLLAPALPTLGGAGPFVLVDGAPVPARLLFVGAGLVPAGVAIAAFGALNPVLRSPWQRRRHAIATASLAAWVLTFAAAAAGALVVAAALQLAAAGGAIAAYLPRPGVEGAGEPERRRHTIQLTLPEGGWCHVVPRAHPDLLIEVLEVVPAGPGVQVETVRVTGPAWRRALHELTVLDASAGGSGVEVLDDEPARGTVRIRIPACGLCPALAHARVTPQFPLQITDEGCPMVVIATPADAQRLATELTKRHLEARVVATRQDDRV